MIRVPPFPDELRPGKFPMETRAFLITDIEVFTAQAWFLARMIARHDLADAVLQVGLDWEHLVALAPFDPATPGVALDPLVQAEIDRLDEATEAVVEQINQAAEEFESRQPT